MTGIHDVPASFVREQMDAVFSDLNVKAVKIGMLFNAEIIMAVAHGLKAHDCQSVVLDPVMIATSGDPLLVDEAVSAMQEHLFPLVDLITPNLHEAAHLTGLDVATNDLDMELQAAALLKLGAKAVLVKGGHSAGALARDFILMAMSARGSRLNGLKPTTRTERVARFHLLLQQGLLRI